MRPIVDVVDMLMPVYAPDAPGVHLALSDWDEHGTSAARTLCGEPVQQPARSPHFLTGGCLTCAKRAARAGIPLVRDGNFVVGLRRFIEQRNGT